jgi:tetratricopeptide (TPR) repeat protein
MPFLRNRILAASVVALFIVVMGVGASAQPHKSRSSTKKQGELSSPDSVDYIVDGIVDQLRVQTDRHWHKGEYSHMINLYRMEIVAHPDNVDAYSSAGWLLWSMDRDAEAVAMYEEGIKANSDSFYMYDELGQYYFQRKKDYPRAIVYYEKAVGFKDVPFVTLHMLAHAYEKTRQYDKALAIWKRTLATFPDDQPAKVNLERVKRLVGKG